MRNTARAVIDLAALRHNLEVVRGICPQSQVMAMIKADAYGHGALPAARALAAADGFAVARLEEALQLREGGVRHRVLLLGTLLEPAELTLCSQLGIDVTVHDAASLELIVAAARVNPLRVWLKLDSGMHRLGLDPAGFVAAGRALSEVAGATEVVHMTHFSSTREMDSTAMARQLACFEACHASDPKRAVSLANSATLIAKPPLRSGWVRPGIMLYGDNPLAASHPVTLRAVMHLTARILALRSIQPGAAVGYDGCWTAMRPSLIATLGIGYADGYPRHAPNGTPVRIADCIVPLVGRVSMDSITVDATDCAGLAPGAEATLWGPGLPVSQVASYAGTASYELLAGLGQRVTREYLG